MKHVWHDSGAYLGVLTGRRGVLVFFEGTRTRDGVPVTMATIHEVEIRDDGPV